MSARRHFTECKGMALILVLSLTANSDTSLLLYPGEIYTFHMLQATHFDLFSDLMM